MNKYWILIGLFFLVSGDKTLSYLYVAVSDSHFKIDHKNKLIISHLENIKEYEDIVSYSDIIIFMGNRTIKFIEKPESLMFEASYKVSMDEEVWTLYFTPLPIISIETNNYIIDEPKVPAILRYADYKKEITSHVGIEKRGGSSLVYPKVTYDLEFWKSASGAIPQNVQLGNLRNDDDWILDALYNEPLRLRSYFAHMLWLDLRNDNMNKNYKRMAEGAKVQHVEVFVKGLYCGIYNLSEQVDRKQLGLKKYKENNINHGELYQGAAHTEVTAFKRIKDYDNSVGVWSGFELKYPKVQDHIEWKKLHDFVHFVVNSSDVEFINQACDNFQCDNLIDYFIFLNFLRATDNLGKNIYLAKQNQDEPYFYVPWDLDGILGINSQGKNLVFTEDILSNEFLSRARRLSPNYFNARLIMRWRSLRSSVLKTENVLFRLREGYNFLDKNRIYEREKRVYPNYEFDKESLEYLLNWTTRRLEFLDDYYYNTVNAN